MTRAIESRSTVLTLAISRTKSQRFVLQLLYLVQYLEIGPGRC